MAAHQWHHFTNSCMPPHRQLRSAERLGGVRAALRRAAGIWSLLGERVICQAAGEPRGHCHAFVPPSLSFPPSDFFFSLCFQLRMQHSPRFPPTVPVLIFFPLYKYVFLRLLLLPAQLPPSVLPSQTSFFSLLLVFPQALFIPSLSCFSPSLQPLGLLFTHSVSPSLTVWGKSVCVNTQIPLFIG